MVQQTVTRTDLFSTRKYDDFKKYLLNDTAGLQKQTFVNDLTIAEILQDDPDRLQKYVQDRYINQIISGDFDDEGNSFKPTEQEKREAVRLAELPRTGTDDPYRAERFEKTRAYLRRYEKPEQAITLDLLPRDVLEESDDRKFPITTLGTMVGAGTPPTKRRPAATEYGTFTEDVFISEAEREELRKYNVNPDRFFEAGMGFLEKYLNDNPSLLNTAGMGLSGLLAQQADISSESPWRLKAFFLPMNPTPEEMEFVMKNEFPNIEGKIREINPRDPSAGLAIRVPKIDGKEGEFEDIPLRPQFGMQMLTEEGINMVGYETGTLITEALLTQGRGTVAKLIRQGTEDLAKLPKKGGIRRAFGSATTTSIASAFGRYAQMVSAREQGIIDISEERILQDTQLAALLAGAGSVGVSAAMGVLSTIYRVVTGKNIPNSFLQKLQTSIGKLEKAEKTSEFTNKELIQLAKEAGRQIGDNYEFRPTLGQLTEDTELQTLEQDLYALLAGSGSKATEAYEDIVLNNREAARSFWNALTEGNPELQKINLVDFQDYIRRRNKETLESFELAAEIEKERIAKASGIQIEDVADIPQTTSELAEPFTRDVRTGGLVFKRNTKEFGLDASEQYKELLSGFETELGKLSNLKYSTPEESTALINDAFRRVLNAGDEDSIIKTLADAELGQTIKDIIPMKNGVSVLRQLAGILTDKEGKEIPALDLNYGDLVSMRNAVETLLLTHPDNAVKKAAKPLLDAIDAQADDLLLVRARQDLAEMGNNNPTPARLKRYVEQEAPWTEELFRARDRFESFKDNFDLEFLKNLSNQRPEEIAPFILSSTPDQIEKLLQNIYSGSDSIVKLQNIRQLVLDDVRKSVGQGDLASQNKAWKEYFEQNEDQLRALFRDAEFLKMKNYSKVQEQAAADIQKVTEKVSSLEKELGIEESFSDFIGALLSPSKMQRVTGKDKQALEKFRAVVDRYPELEGLLSDITKGHMKRLLESYRLGAPTSRGETGEFFVGGGFNFDGFKKFIDEGLGSGEFAQEGLADRFKLIYGPKTGREYVQNLRALGFIFDKVNRKSKIDPILTTDSKATKNTLDGFVEMIRTGQRIFISPLTRLSRQITFGTEKVRGNAADNLLQIMIDPKKLDVLIKSRNRAMSYREFLEFLGGLAAARSGVDIGSSRDERAIEKLVKELEVETPEEVEDVTGIKQVDRGIDTMSRIFDMLNPLD